MCAYMTETQLVIKMVIIGDSGVGKTTLYQSYVEPSENPKSMRQPTIGVDFKVLDRTMTLNNKVYHIKFQIWDTAGQERYKAIAGSYFRDIDGVLFVFQAPENQFEQSYASMRNIKNWYEFSKLHADPDRAIVRAICMTKTDRLEPDIKDHVSEQGKDLAAVVCGKDTDIKRVYNVSYETPEKIQRMFDHMLKQMVEVKVANSPPDNNPKPLRRRSAQKLFVVSIKDSVEPSPSSPSMDLLKKEETSSCCGST